MEEEKKQERSFELRREKVRSIVGQIPSSLVRYVCYNNRFATLAYWIFTLVGTGGPAPWRWPLPDR